MKISSNLKTCAKFTENTKRLLSEAKLTDGNVDLPGVKKWGHALACRNNCATPKWSEGTGLLEDD